MTERICPDCRGTGYIISSSGEKIQKTKEEMLNFYYAKVISYFTEAIRIDPNDANAYYNRGNAYYDKREYDRAISDFNQVLKIDPNDAKAYYNRGAAYCQKEDYNKAWDDICKAQKLGYQINPEFLEALRRVSGKEIK